MTIAIVIVVVLVVAFVGLTVARRRGERAGVDAQTRVATVLGTREIVVGGEPRWFASFRFEDGEEEDFAIDARDYAALVEGTTGEITHKEMKYIGFRTGKRVS